MYMDKYIREYKKGRKWTQMVHEKLKDGTFKNDKRIMDELMDDSNLHEDAYNYGKIRIGEKYQCVIPEYKPQNKWYNPSNKWYKPSNKSKYTSKHNYNLRSKNK